MRYLLVLAALAVGFTATAHADGFGQVHYAPLEYQLNYQPPYSTMSPYYGPVFMHTHYAPPPGCLQSAPLFVKPRWGAARYAPPPPPPGFTWHPWVRSPRDFFMMERP